MFHRIWHLVWKEIIQFLRHRLLLIFVLIFPIWNLVSVADMVSRGILHIPAAVYDADRSQASREMVAMLRHTRLFDPDDYASSRRELDHLLAQGTARAGFVIPPNFGANLAAGQATVQVLLDGSETTTALVAQAYLEGMAYEYARQSLDERLNQGPVIVEEAELIEVRSRVWFNEDMRREIFQLPGEMAGGVALLAVLLPAVVIIKERESGTLEQLFVAPLRPIELIAGKGLPALLITFLVFLGMLAMNVLYFRVPLRGSLGLLLILTIYYIFIEMGWGLLISTVARTQAQGFLGAFFVVLSEIVLSGQVLPVEYMPRAAQFVAYVMPNNHFNVIVRSIMLKGASLAELWPQVIVLGVVGVILYALVINRLRQGLE